MSFLVFRYAVVLATLVSLYVVVRFGSWKAAVALPGALGAILWLYSYLPLVQPYGLSPGTKTSFDLALLSQGAARGEMGEAFVTNMRNPRPGWSGLGALAAAASPENARHLMELLTPLLLVGFPLALFWLLRGCLRLDPWLAAAATFVGALAPTLALDVFAPQAVFHQAMFFVTPRRALSLTLALIGLGLAWKDSRVPRVASGVVLGAIAWLDTSIFLFALLTIAATEILSALHPSRPVVTARPWLAILIAAAVAAPVLMHWFSPDLLKRLPPSDEVASFRLAFVDVLGVTMNLGFSFALALVGAFYCWRESRSGSGSGTRCQGVIALTLASYVLWLGSGISYFLRPFAEADVSFHLVRFTVSVLAGVGAWSLGRALASLVARTNRRTRIDLEARSWTFALVVVFFLPMSAPFVWRPMMTDPLYYPSTYEWDTSLVRLERFLLENSTPDDVFLTGDETGEWIAALTGRRVYKVDDLLPRAEARSRRQTIRRLFVSDDGNEMRNAMEAAAAEWLVLDPELREIYWEFDENALEGSGSFQKVHDIGDRYSIYRLAGDTLESRYNQGYSSSARQR